MNDKKNNIFPIEKQEKISENPSKTSENVDYCSLPFSDDNNKDILLINIQNKSFDHSKASLFMNFMKEKINSEYKFVIFDFSECTFMDSTFLGAVIVTLKSLASKNIEASIIFNTEKFTSLHLVEFSLEKLKKKVHIFSTIQQVEDHFNIQSIEDKLFVLSKVV